MSKIQELKEQANQLFKENGYSNWGVSLKEEAKLRKAYNKFRRLRRNGYAYIPGNCLR